MNAIRKNETLKKYLAASFLLLMPACGKSSNNSKELSNPPLTINQPQSVTNQVIRLPEQANLSVGQDTCDGWSISFDDWNYGPLPPVSCLQGGIQTVLEGTSHQVYATKVFETGTVVNSISFQRSFSNYSILFWISGLNTRVLVEDLDTSEILLDERCHAVRDDSTTGMLEPCLSENLREFQYTIPEQQHRLKVSLTLGSYGISPEMFSEPLTLDIRNISFFYSSEKDPGPFRTDG